MKLSATLIAFLIAFFFYGCKKDTIISGTSTNPNPFFDSVVQYLKSTLSQKELEKLDFANSKTLVYKNQNFGIQIFEKNNVDKFILLQNQHSMYSGNWVDMSGFILGSSHYNSGTIILNSLNKNCTTKLNIDSNMVIKVERTYPNDATVYTTNLKKENYFKKNPVSSLPDFESPMLPEIVIYYDVNGGGGIDLLSWYWLMDQVGSYGYDYFYGGSGGGGSSGGGNNGPGATNMLVAPKYFPPDTPIKDLDKELKCLCYLVSKVE